MCRLCNHIHWIHTSNCHPSLLPKCAFTKQTRSKPNSILRHMVHIIFIYHWNFGWEPKNGNQIKTRVCRKTKNRTYFSYILVANSFVVYRNCLELCLFDGAQHGCCVFAWHLHLIMSAKKKNTHTKYEWKTHHPANKWRKATKIKPQTRNAYKCFKWRKWRNANHYHKHQVVLELRNFYKFLNSNKQRGKALQNVHDFHS